MSTLANHGTVFVYILLLISQPLPSNARDLEEKPLLDAQERGAAFIGYQVHADQSLCRRYAASLHFYNFIYGSLELHAKRIRIRST